MKTPTVITTSLPEELIELLSHYSIKFKIPKNKILEEALKSYFEKLRRAEYIRSFRRAAGNEEMLNLAEEGLSDYLKILEE